MYSSKSVQSNVSAKARDAVADTDERTRDRVRSAILKHGPISAAQLGNLLGFTPAAVRRHLDQLAKDGVIEVKLLRGPGTGAGRPSRHYVLSSQGQSVFGDDYLDIARLALEQLAQVRGREGVEQFAADRFAAMERRLEPLLAEVGDDVLARAKVLSDALNREGYAARSQEIGRGSAHVLRAVQLCQGHCPVIELAAEFPEFCEAETQAFSRMLGVDVRRLSTLAAGGHVCTTHIPRERGMAAASRTGSHEDHLQIKRKAED